MIINPGVLEEFKCKVQKNMSTKLTNLSKIFIEAFLAIKLAISNLWKGWISISSGMELRHVAERNTT